MDYRKLIVAALGGFVLALRLDLHAYNAAKKADPKARFDFGLAIPRWIEGALGGLIVAAGWQSV